MGAHAGATSLRSFAAVEAFLLTADGPRGRSSAARSQTAASAARAALRRSSKRQAHPNAATRRTGKTNSAPRAIPTPRTASEAPLSRGRAGRAGRSTAAPRRTAASAARRAALCRRPPRRASTCLDGRMSLGRLASSTSSRATAQTVPSSKATSGRVGASSTCLRRTAAPAAAGCGNTSRPPRLLFEWHRRPRRRRPRRQPVKPPLQQGSDTTLCGASKPHTTRGSASDLTSAGTCLGGS